MLLKYISLNCLFCFQIKQRYNTLYIFMYKVQFTGQEFLFLAEENIFVRYTNQQLRFVEMQPDYYAITFSNLIFYLNKSQNKVLVIVRKQVYNQQRNVDYITSMLFQGFKLPCLIYPSTKYVICCLLVCKNMQLEQLQSTRIL